MTQAAPAVSNAAAAVALTPAQSAGLNDPHLLAQCEVDVPSGGGLRRIGLGLSGMHCAACAIAVEGELLKVPGVAEVQVQAASRRARILLDPARGGLSELVAAVRRAGYQAWPDAAGRASHARLHEQRRLLWRLSVAAFCMMQVMMITTMQYVAAPGEIPEDLWRLMNWAGWVLSLPVMAFSCGPFFSGAWRAAMQGRVSMDTPAAIGMGVTFVASTASTFGGQDVFGREVYFDSLTMFVTFLLAGRWLESRAREQVTRSLEAICTRLPEAVERAVDASDDLAAARTESVAVSALRRGDRVRVAVGQAFPADGRVLRGITEVDESMLTGESRAVPRAQGQLLVAGSLNLGAPVWMTVERLGSDTRYQQIVALVHQALTEKPGWMRQADRFAGPFLWAVLALAALGALAWQWIDPARSVWVAVSVLIVTCPCALSLAAPSALLAAAGAMARQGVLVRRLDAIEALARVDQVYFDKTGTLTESSARVVAWLDARGRHPADSFPDGDHRADTWRTAAGLAAFSQHPLSRSLVEAVAAKEALQGPAPVLRDVKEQAGRGVEACDEQGRAWRLGSVAWVLADAPQAWARQGEAGDARVWLAARDPHGQVLPDTVLGIVFDEVIRPEAVPAIRELAAQGCRTSLLSGDQAARVAAAVAQLSQAGAVQLARAEASPEDKLRIVAQAQAEGHSVAVVGDGINDAPVLAKADVSIALDQGAALAHAQADMIVLGGRLKGVPMAMRTARQAMRVVRQNLAWAALYNAACIPLALAGWLPPWLAGLGMALSSLAVVLNALRLGGIRP